MRQNDAIISLKHSLQKFQNEAGKNSELSGLIDWVSEFIVADGVPFEDSSKSKFASLISVALNLLRSGSHHSVLSEIMVAAVPSGQDFRGTVEDWIPLFLLDPADTSARRGVDTWLLSRGCQN